MSTNDKIMTHMNTPEFQERINNITRLTAALLTREQFNGANLQRIIANAEEIYNEILRHAKLR